jgi:hypothetical protein
MTQTTKKPTKRSAGSTQSGGVRRIGYIVSIVIMIVMIYILRHLRQWGVTFLNEDFENALFYIELSIYVSIGINILFIIYDNRWFKHLLQGISNIFGALAIIMLYVIYPFVIQDESWNKWIKIGLLVLFLLVVIGTLVEFIKGFRDLAKNPEKI